MDRQDKIAQLLRSYDADRAEGGGFNKDSRTLAAEIHETAWLNGKFVDSSEWNIRVLHDGETSALGLVLVHLTEYTQWLGMTGYPDSPEQVESLRSWITTKLRRYTDVEDWIEEQAEEALSHIAHLLGFCENCNDAEDSGDDYAGNGQGPIPFPLPPKP